MLRIIQIIIVSMWAVVGLTAQSSYTLRSSEMTITGTSSLHDWESRVTALTARGRITMGAATLEAIPELLVTIKARDIVSPKGSIMDNKTYEALKADAHPTITYRLSRVKSIQPSGQGFTVSTEGQLTIAGVTRTIDMTVAGRRQADGTIVFEGSKALKMTNFNMSPPTALMGTIKTGDDITVKFRVTLAPAN